MNSFLYSLFVIGAALMCPSSLAYDGDHHFGAKDRVFSPVIAIIIDDLGNQIVEGKRAIDLPGPLAFAILPHTPHARSLAEYAHAVGKEVMLHLPLEATDNNALLGDGAVMIDDSEHVFRATLFKNLSAIPHVVGVNNHMGSLLTRHPGHMRWLMRLLKQHDNLYFVDSFTTAHSVALDIARDHDVPAVKRDVFLDSDIKISAINNQIARLRNIARTQGYAVAIGHPFPQTLTVLEKELPRFEKLGYRLISVKSMIDYQQLLTSHTTRSQYISTQQP